MIRHIFADLVVAFLLLAGICAAVAYLGAQDPDAQCCSCVEAPSL